MLSPTRYEVVTKTSVEIMISIFRSGYNFYAKRVGRCCNNSLLIPQCTHFIFFSVLSNSYIHFISCLSQPIGNGSQWGNS